MDFLWLTIINAIVNFTSHRAVDTNIKAVRVNKLTVKCHLADAYVGLEGEPFTVLCFFAEPQAFICRCRLCDVNDCTKAKT